MTDKIVDLYPERTDEILAELPKDIGYCIRWLIEQADAIDFPLVIVTVKDKKAAISASQICFEDSRLEMQGALVDAAMGISNPSEVLLEFTPDDEEDSVE